jgi:hypothetical protein
MTTERRPSPSWEPTWRRLVGSTVVLFVVILAFLVGRVRAGGDPGLARTATPATQSAPPAASGAAPQSQGVDPNDPFGQQQTDPGTNGTTDNFGNAVPDQSGGSQDSGRNGGTQDSDPPSTHVS